MLLKRIGISSYFDIVLTNYYTGQVYMSVISCVYFYLYTMVSVKIIRLLYIKITVEIRYWKLLLNCTDHHIITFEK